MESAPLEPGNFANLLAIGSVGFIDRQNTPHTHAPTRPGALARKAQLFTFPVKMVSGFGFCSKPERIKVSPLICKLSEGVVLHGCKATEGCKALSIPN
jgi:hypothetical protein